MATFHRAAGDRRGALSKRHWALPQHRRAGARGARREADAGSPRRVRAFARSGARCAWGWQPCTPCCSSPRARMAAAPRGGMGRGRSGCRRSAHHARTRAALDEARIPAW